MVPVLLALWPTARLERTRRLALLAATTGIFVLLVALEGGDGFHFKHWRLLVPLI